ncbi:hypothetical protein P4Y70_28990, partial [Bacillus thuringiensis]|uniref:hypothetical protein n=1 Tax=Bacillus thuringiensis TaxID=1428 RepID=UPI002DB889AB
KRDISFTILLNKIFPPEFQKNYGFFGYLPEHLCHTPGFVGSTPVQDVVPTHPPAHPGLSGV